MKSSNDNFLLHFIQNYCNLEPDEIDMLIKRFLPHHLSEVERDAITGLAEKVFAEYEADQAAIVRVKNLIAKFGAHEARLAAPPALRLGTVDATVRQAISRLPNQFTLGDVVTKLQVIFPAESIKRASVASVLYRMAEAGELKVIQEGVGRRPAIYEKPQEQKT